jgi:FkbM family methyltransferase
MDDHTPPPDLMIDLIATNKAIAARLEELIHLTRIGQLQDGHIFRFLHDDEEIRLSLPLAERDFIQRNILKSGTFYEIRLLEALRAKAGIASGSIIYDVGANIGNHSVYFAKTFRPAYLVSIEPQQSALKILKENIALNGIENADVINCMLGSQNGTGAMASFGSANLGGTSFREDAGGGVPMRRLDDVIAEQTGGEVDFVKIDVEGMHVEVLTGAEAMLREARPVIWIELRDFKDEHTAAQEILGRYGYRQTMKLGPHDYVFAPG